MTTAQLQASDPAYSVWVAASAGTGKTTVLTSRVLRLLLNNTNPGKILCLTYTKAGAAEMECRIKARLCRWVTLPENELIVELTKLTTEIPSADTIKLARKLFLETLDTPDGIKIQTIHSFCQGLMRRFPLEAGIVPHFKVMDDKTSRELLKEARLKLLSDSDIYTAEIKASITNIFRRIREGTFSEVIEGIISDRGKLGKAIAQSGGVEGLKKAIFGLLEVDEGQDEYAVLKNAMQEANFNRKELHATAIGLLNEKGVTFIERGKIICNWLEQDEKGRLENFHSYKLAYLTKEEAPRAALLPAKTNIPPEPIDFEKERICRLIRAIKRTRLALLSSSMVDIACSLLALYDIEKSGKAYLDYNDLITKAENLLSGTDIAPWVLYKLDGGIDHLLLDEAQDTSLAQWHIIDSLCSEFFTGSGARDVERTIFVVGDEKQSIFSFQGAAPHIFNKMRYKFQERAEQAGKQWLNVRLDESFRSAPVVLRAVDAVSQGLGIRTWGLGNHNNLESTSFNINAASSPPPNPQSPIPNLHIPHHKTLHGKVEIWPLIERQQEEEQSAGWVMPLEYKDKQNPPKILAEKIASTIKKWLDNGRIIEATGQKVRAGDIIILLRKRTNMADNIISSLKSRNVAVAGHDRLIITEHIAVMDLMALGNFLLLPEDSLSLACVLKSPLIGFSEEDLFQVAYGRDKKSLWQALKERAKDAQNPPHFQHAVEYLSNLLNKVDYFTPFKLYCYILEAIGGRKKLVQRLGEEINDPVDEFLSLSLEFEKSHAPSLQGFLNWLESGKSEIKRDMEQSGTDAVRVMTVHGSKGLEAPIVIMPDTTTVPETKMKIFWHEDDNANILLWPGGSHNEEEFCDAIKENKKMEEKQEYYRLLYVAMTRAKFELYVAGSVGKKSRPDWCWYDVIYSALDNIRLPRKQGFGEADARSEYHRTVSVQGVRADSRNAATSELPTKTLFPWKSIAEKDADGILRLSGGNPAIIKESQIKQAAVFAPLPAYLLNKPESEPNPTRPLTPSKIEGEQGAEVYSPSSRAKLMEGKIIHSLLEFLPDIFEANRMDKGLEFLRKKFPTAENVEIESILANLLAIMCRDDLKHVFSETSRAEVPVIGIAGGMVISGRIDRLGITDDKVIIVDYKTGRIPPKSISAINRAYIKQMSVYKDIIKEIYPAKQVECYLIWTEGAVVFKLPEETLGKQASVV